VPRPLLTKWCLDDSPAVAGVADLRESARSSFADAGDFNAGGPATAAATGRAISLLPLTEDASPAAEVFVTTATSGSSGGDVELIDQFAPLRVSEDSGESSGIILLREGSSSSSNDDADNEVDASQTKPKFATQQFQGFVDFGSF
jgi:hypothetical protein